MSSSENREERRKWEREQTAIITKAKQDMQEYISKAGKDTTEGELMAWQQGYLAGINRATAAHDNL